MPKSIFGFRRRLSSGGQKAKVASIGSPASIANDTNSSADKLDHPSVSSKNDQYDYLPVPEFPANPSGEGIEGLALKGGPSRREILELHQTRARRHIDGTVQSNPRGPNKPTIQ
jgi:hypothetical protein